MAQPLFIFGAARSGTTWLGNLLAAHSQISAVEHAVHWGQKENNIVATYRLAGSLEQSASLIDFLERFAASDFFRLAGGDKDAIYRSGPRDYFDVFFSLMDQLASRDGATYWLTKYDPEFFYAPSLEKLFLQRMEERYGDGPRAVMIGRPFDEVLRSYLRMEGKESVHLRRGLSQFAGATLQSARYVDQNRAFDSRLPLFRGSKLAFAQLRADPETTLTSILAALSLEFEQGMATPRFPKNSSAHRSLPGGRAVETATGRLIAPLFEASPPVAAAVMRAYRAIRKPPTRLYYRLMRLETFPDEFERELRESGQLFLADHLFPKDD